MESLGSQSTQNQSELGEDSMLTSGSTRQFKFASILVGAIALSVALWTWLQWSNRTRTDTGISRNPIWTLETSSAPAGQAFVRVQNTSFWNRQPSGILTSNSHVAARIAPVTLRVHSQDQVSVPGLLTVAPESIVHAERGRAEVVSGFVRATGPVRVAMASGDRFIRENESVLIHSSQTAAGSTTEIVPEIEPRVGTIHDLQTTGFINFSWPKALASTNATLEFARDPAFNQVLFSHPASGAPQATVDFSDRSPGAWFVRLVELEKAVAFTALNVVESEMPDQLRRMGRRWFAWRSRGLSTMHRLELSGDESFQKIDQSFQTRNREFDLTLAQAGNFFARVVSVSISGRELTSRPVQLEIQDKSEILRAGLELNDPNLKMSARGWKIVLSSGEAARIREGYVILRDSELRGIKVASEVIQDFIQDVKTRVDIRERLVFEISRDEIFSNPERVKPDSHGELLPPALPLGVLYARLRRVELDGSLGAFGPASRLTTLLPAPTPQKSKPSKVRDISGVELNWNLDADVAGFELRVSPTRQFEDGKTHVIRTRANYRNIASPTLREFFWTVAAINEFGQPISLVSDVQEVKDLGIDQKPKLQIAKSKIEKPITATIQPRTPELHLPAEDAVVVGGATATKYGKLTWSFTGTNEGFEVQVATDNDFVNVIAKAKTKKNEYTLQGDLPEGALFWRVRLAGKTRAPSSSNEWSRSRKFDLVYE